jgi:hypothetical protein
MLGAEANWVHVGASANLGEILHFRDGIDKRLRISEAALGFQILLFLPKTSMMLPVGYCRK